MLEFFLDTLINSLLLLLLALLGHSFKWLQHCSNIATLHVLRLKSSLQIVSCNITFGLESKALYCYHQRIVIVIFAKQVVFFLFSLYLFIYLFIYPSIYLSI